MSITRRGRSLSFDLLIIGFSSIAALALRENFSIAARQWDAFVPYLICTLAVSLPTLVLLGMDRSIWRFSGLADYVHALYASALIVAGAAVIGFIINRMDGVARSLPLLQIVLMTAGLVGVRVLTRVVHKRRRTHNHGQLALPAAEDTVLVIGWSSMVELFVRSAAEFGSSKLHIAGILSPNERHVGRVLHAVPVLGTPEEADRIISDLEVHGVHVGRIVVAVPFDRLSEDARVLLREIESTTEIRLEFFAERLGFSVDREPSPASRAGVPAAGPGGYQPAFAIETAEIEQVLRRPYWRVKRFIDAAVALAMLVILSPLIIVAALVVALDGGLPVLFVQQRPGLRGHRFKLYKFRTMGRSHDAAGHRIPDEARISRVGTFLRRTRLDELPQLFNILVGDMSFVGPRPLVSREQSREIVARLLVRPGLTGWAQVYGGRSVSVTDKTALDLWYVRHASLWLDLKILVSTLPIVLFGERVDGDVVRLAWQDLHRLAGRGGVGE